MTEKRYAKIDDKGNIENIVVVDPDPIKAEKWISKQKGRWIEYNENNEAFRGGRYDNKMKKFIKPKPHRAFILDKNGEWIPPKPKPRVDPQLHRWNDETEEWEVVRNRALDQ